MSTQVLEKYAWAFFLALLVGSIAFVVWLRNRVTAPPPPPILTLAVTPTSVQAESPVVISGTLLVGTTPQASKTVQISITPPSGDGYSESAITDVAGAFSKSWPTPAAPIGTYTVAVAYAGATTVSKTFTIAQPEKRRESEK